MSSSPHAPAPVADRRSGVDLRRIAVAVVALIGGVLLIASAMLTWARVDGTVTVPERPGPQSSRSSPLDLQSVLPSSSASGEEVTADVSGLGAVSELVLTPNGEGRTGRDRAHPDDVRAAITAETGPWGVLALAAGVLALISAALVLVPVLRPVGLTALLAAGVTGMTAGAVTLIGTAADAEARSDYLLGRAEVPDTTTLLASLTAGPGAGLALGAAIAVSVAALAGVYLAVPGRLRIPPARLVTAALAGVATVAGVTLACAVVLPWVTVEGTATSPREAVTPAEGTFGLDQSRPFKAEFSAEVLGLGTVSALTVDADRPGRSAPERVSPVLVRTEVAAEVSPWGPVAVGAGVLAVLSAGVYAFTPLRLTGAAALLAAGAAGVIAALHTLITPNAGIDSALLTAATTSGPGAMTALGAALAVLVSALVAAHLAAGDRLRQSTSSGSGAPPPNRAGTQYSPGG